MIVDSGISNWHQGTLAIPHLLRAMDSKGTHNNSDIKTSPKQICSDICKKMHTVSTAQKRHKEYVLNKYS
jgi:hypothetical protein